MNGPGVTLKGLKEKLFPEGEEKAEVEAITNPTKHGMLRQMNISGYNLYVPPAPGIIRERRIKNKAARKARRVARTKR